MRISHHPWPPDDGFMSEGVLAIDDESGHAVAVVSEGGWQSNANLAEKRLRKASVLREQIAERDAEIAQLRSALAASSKACDALEDIGKQASKRIDELEQRQRDHLALIVKLTNETPFADEIAGWRDQRAKMIAEIGTLKARIEELESK